MQITDAAINEAARIANQSSVFHLGLRIEHGVTYKTGEYLPDSRVWVDGEPTDETLDGTSVICLDNYTDDEGFLTADAVRQAIENAGAYVGTHIIVVAQDDHPSIGEDAGERIFRAACCIGSINI